MKKLRAASVRKPRPVSLLEHRDNTEKFLIEEFKKSISIKRESKLGNGLGALLVLLFWGFIIYKIVSCFF
jgi:hypothetical protein